MAMYTVVTYKRQGGIGGKPWDNSYEIVTNGSVESVSLKGNDPERLLLLRAAGAIATMEQTIHLNTTYIDRVGIRTWEPDSEVYEGDELVTLPISAMGTRVVPAGQQALGIDDTLYVRRQPKTGQLGKITYRGVLLEADSNVNANGIKNLEGSSPVANGGSLWETASAAVADGLMDWGQQGADEWAFVMIHNPTSETVVARPVIELVPAGIVPMKLNKKWHNKGAAALQRKIDELTEKLAVLQQQLPQSD